MRQRLDDAEIFGGRFWNGTKFKAMVVSSMGADLVLNEKSPTLINLDPTAARNLTMPAVANNDGLVFILNHMGTGAFDITIKNSAAATIGTLSQNEAGIVIIIGATTYFRLWGTTT